MKIDTTNVKNRVQFSEIKVGEPFGILGFKSEKIIDIFGSEHDQYDYNPGYYMRVEYCCRDGFSCNACNLETGKLAYFDDDNDVYRIPVKVVVIEKDYYDLF